MVLAEYEVKPCIPKSQIYQPILLLRRARRDAQGRTRERLDKLIEAQKRICAEVEEICEEQP